MIQVISDWLRRYFSDPQAVYLAVLLVLGFSIVIFMGGMLLPVFASIVIAYLLDGLVIFLDMHGSKRTHAVMLVFLVFLAFLVFVFFGLFPLLARQIAEFFQALPEMIARGQEALTRLPELYPFISEEQVLDAMQMVRSELGDMGHNIVSQSVASMAGIITVTVYVVLMPLLVFFFLKDKWAILKWFDRFLPKKRTLMASVWKEMDTQLGNYVRGKFWEILIVGVASVTAFALLGLQYAILLGALVGLSVVVPYIGAVAVTFPVALVAFFQWGWSPEFAYLIIAYSVIQVLDGIVLVPLMFSEVVNLHPIAIIVAVLVFGGLWGFWGVFFAIPLATLVQALITAWPRTQEVASE
ncbi:MAG: AI-2E family transporter [Gammaproteobacteria bacterium]|nr:MAG: AI-2E family transporter [Gammaproteobacteria bacterium]